MINKCKICGGNLISFITFEETPKAAQHLPDAKALASDSGIQLEIFQCIGCGTVQIPTKPVSYYSHAIRSPDWNIDPFRKKQRIEFIEEFSLQTKRIKQINREPKPDKYDAFTMFNYLEHFPSPKNTLMQICENLEDSGVGIVEVPNFDEIIRDRAFGEFIIDHLFYFTEKTLRFICEAAGFEVLRIQEIWGGASLSATIRKRTLLTAKPFKENQKKLIQDIDNFIDKFESVTIWGAGHQALMMLPMINNLNKIPYIVDDFKAKQYLYTPIIHKQILPHQQLTDEPINAIIVIVGWQYKKVLKCIEGLNLSPKPTIALIKKATLKIL